MVYNVAVLMSTYNGDKYIKEQLDSLFNQYDVEINLFIRDDLSTDNTVDIIKNYPQPITLIENKGINIGVGRSFMELIYTVGMEYDFIALCDQDDIWEADKLVQAIRMIENKDRPTLYCSNQLLVDDNNKEIGMRHQGMLETSYLQILTNNHFTGCTMVWNGKLQEQLVCDKKRPTCELLSIRIHDVWIAMVASITGDIVYDPNSYIRYRQHANNVVGVRKEKKLKIWKKKFLNPTLRNGRSILAKEILVCFREQMDFEKVNTLLIYSTYSSNLVNKFKLITQKRFFRYSKESAFTIFIKIIFNVI